MNDNTYCSLTAYFKHVLFSIITINEYKYSKTFHVKPKKNELELKY